MSHRKHSAQREAKEALRDPGAETAARIDELLHEAQMPLALPGTMRENEPCADGAPLESTDEARLQRANGRADGRRGDEHAPRAAAAA